MNPKLIGLIGAVLFLIAFVLPSGWGGLPFVVGIGVMIWACVLGFRGRTT